MDAEKHLVAGLDYEVAVARRVQRGRGGTHVTSTGSEETTFAHLTFGVQYLYSDVVNRSLTMTFLMRLFLS